MKPWCLSFKEVRCSVSQNNNSNNKNQQNCLLFYTLGSALHNYGRGFKAATSQQTELVLWEQEGIVISHLGLLTRSVLEQNSPFYSIVS